jgi:geranylgeranyl diphosphate synthase type I
LGNPHPRDSRDRLAVALDAASDADARLLRNSIGRPIGDAELAAARDVLVRSGAVAEIERQIADRRDAGLARIDALDCPAEARADLTSMAHRVTSRSK